MSDSKSGSKNDLNESNLPLLEEEKAGGGETPEKEQIELEDTAEKEDSGTEKKKEKKKKEKKEKKEKGPSCIDTMTTHLNLSQRDGNKINEVVDVSHRIQI